MAAVLGYSPRWCARTPGRRRRCWATHHGGVHGRRVDGGGAWPLLTDAGAEQDDDDNAANQDQQRDNDEH